MEKFENSCMQHLSVKHAKTVGKSMALFVGLLLLAGCRSDLTRFAGDNAWQLERVLIYYKYIHRDAEKYEAAKFLIENMQYHQGRGRILSVPSEVEAWRAETDSIYWATVAGHTLSDFPWDSLRVRQQRRRAVIEADTLDAVQADMELHPDAETMTFRFLTQHIDHAFHVWRESRYASHLSFDEFKEYILPYRSVRGYGFLETGRRYDELFGKYILQTDSDSLESTVTYYNRMANGLRDLSGKTHSQGLAGIYGLYSRDFHDCVDIASYGCNILRACGIPTVVEYNVCYREWAGRHYHCSVYNDSTRKWECFTPESSLPGDGTWSFAPCMNIYRSTYGAQPESPYFLRAEGEYVPPILDNPCFRDVTALYRETTQVTLPFHAGHSGKLAYLAVYNFVEGLMPVTWATVNSARREVTFKNVLRDVLYFPVYYPSEGYKAFGQPFYIHREEGSDRICHLAETDTSMADQWPELLLTRKFPRKENMVQKAAELVEGRFLGANRKDFSDAVTLLKLREVPQPAFSDYPLTRTGSFRYYRYQSPAETPHANISMLEWLAPASLGYTNVLPPTPPHVTAPQDSLILNSEGRWVKLLDEDSWDKMSWKAEYDGNMQTSPGAYPNITLWLKEPQMITRVRFAPLNADNGIHAGHAYELYYWQDGWQLAGTTTARYEYVTFKNVPKHKLYWLRDRTTGKEELPFVMQDGQQQFIYHNILN